MLLLTTQPATCTSSSPNHGHKFHKGILRRHYEDPEKGIPLGEVCPNRPTALGWASRTIFPSLTAVRKHCCQKSARSTTISIGSNMSVRPKLRATEIGVTAPWSGLPAGLRNLPPLNPLTADVGSWQRPHQWHVYHVR
jgi:hypothetical protein